MIDLHCHSTASDGSDSPADLMKLAYARNLQAIALTDHDTVNGLAEAADAACKLGLEFIPGIELSSSYRNREVHIVGLNITPTQSLKDSLAVMLQKRTLRNNKLIEKIRADGLDISYQTLTDMFGANTIINRAHFARYFVYKGYASSVDDAFARYFHDNGKYYVKKLTFDYQESIQMILEAGGIPVLAHPFQYHFYNDDFVQMAADFKLNGGIGIECYYSTNTAEQTEYTLKVASRLHLMPSGGSDYHGLAKPAISLGTGKGNLDIPYKIWYDLKNSSTSLASAKKLP